MMSFLHLAGYVASVLIGLSLGLLGGGGSMLTLPVMVYLLGLSPLSSAVYSMFVVGLTSLLGAVGYMRRREVAYRTAAVFAIPSFVAVFLTRKYLVPAIPDPLIALPGFRLGKDVALMILFALVMLVASLGMIGERKSSSSQLPKPFQGKLLALAGVWVGVLTGIMGAGGGFIILPALVLLADLPMKTAVGTSLLIIALNTLLGFASGFSLQEIDWPFLGLFTALSVLGIGLGMYLARFVSGAKLKKAFGWLMLLMALLIILLELSE